PNVVIPASVSGGSTTIASPGVYGLNCSTGSGVEGRSDAGVGVDGISHGGVGVRGSSDLSDAIQGRSKSPDHAGVLAMNEAGGFGLWASSVDGKGVYGKSTSDVGVLGESMTSNGVFGLCHSLQNAAVTAVNDAGGLALWVESKNATQAAFTAHFEGNVEVTGDIQLTNADCAEDFDIHPDMPCAPGTVMVVGDDGFLHQCIQRYDKRVAGVVSGAGD